MKFKLWFEATVGDMFDNPNLPKTVKFSDVKHDKGTGEWIVNLNKTPNTINIKNLQIGDEISDYSLNRTIYWTVDGVDENKGIVYLKPTENNPHIKQVGAGGKELTDFDWEVQDGTYEKKRVDQLLQQWQAGELTDVKDVAYLLLGTVPMNFGPNGAQGGWYNVRDTRSNRGGQKGMEPEDIMKKDANTLKKTFGFKVPTTALNGTMDTFDWNDFMGQTDDPKPGHEVEGEDWKDINKMAEFILNDKQPYLSYRNAVKLIEWYTRGHLPRMYGRNIQDRDKAINATEKWQQGKFDRKELDKFMHDLAAKVVMRKHTKWQPEHDPLWHTKEKFVYLVLRKGWNDLLITFEKHGGTSVRHILAYRYKEKGDYNSLMRMLDSETSAETLGELLLYVLRDNTEQGKKWVKQNMNKIQRIMNTDSTGYYKKNIENLLNWVFTKKELGEFNG